jgi:hypothetical protein
MKWLAGFWDTLCDVLIETMIRFDQVFRKRINAIKA